MERLLARRERLGLTFRELSDETGIPIPTLSYWASKFRREEPEATLVPVTVVEEPAESGLTIETYDGLRVRVEAGFDPQLLARVLSILRSSC